MASRAKKHLKVLMVGNSFSKSVLTYLPKMVKADAHRITLRIRQAYIGGCTIERHLKEFDQAMATPDYRPYLTNLPIPGTPHPWAGEWYANLPEMLRDDAWDIVTIQQGSVHSWLPETYGADAERLIGIIRELAPTAEIVVHETWSYRKDSSMLEKWNITQRQMYRRLSAAYKKLASEHHFRLIPVGDAVELFRQAVKSPYIPLSQADRQKFIWPDLPPNAGDVVGKDFWKKNEETGEMECHSDPIHLNPRGHYLQACVFYMFLFGRKAADIRFFPPDFDNGVCRHLADLAEKALRNYSSQF